MSDKKGTVNKIDNSSVTTLQMMNQKINDKNVQRSKDNATMLNGMNLTLKVVLDKINDDSKKK
jgi:hypothetical protein